MQVLARTRPVALLSSREIFPVHLGKSRAPGPSTFYLAFVATVVLAAHTDAQVTARQGASNTSRQFTSPMVLETVLPVAPGFRRTQLRREIADFTCDGVALQDVWYQVRGNRRAADQPTTLVLDGVVAVPPSFDREVDVLVTITAGGDTLGHQQALRIDAEEGRRTPFRLRVPIARLSGIIGDAPPTAAITLIVRDNR